MKKLLLLLVTLSFALGCFARQKSDSESYNMRRAQEEFENGNVESAIDYYQLEIADNPKNGYAHLFLSLIQTNTKDFKEAMSSVNNAIDNIPKKDAKYKSRAYLSRGRLFAEIGDTVQALNDLADALKIYPANEDAYEKRGQIYFELNRFSEADADYEALIKLNPGGVMGYMGLGRNAYARGEYSDAVKLYDKVLNMYSDYAGGYAFRAESYLEMGKYVEAADDIMKALSIANDTMAFHYLFEFPNDQTPMVAAKLRGMAAKNPHDATWPYYLSQVYAEHNMYDDAINALDTAYGIDAYPPFLLMKAECFEKKGEYGKAYDCLTEAELLMPDDDEVIYKKADVLGEGGDIEGAISGWSKVIEKNPDWAAAYYRRGFFEDKSNKTDEALADYEMAIMLKPDYAYSYLGKGDMLMRKGESEKAMEAYRKVVELDTVPSNSSCAMYAFLALGEKDKAIDFMTRVIENDSTDAGNYYDGACFYSRLGDLDKSLAYLKTSFEKGFRRFHHVMADDDLEELRKTEAFKKLMEEYEKPSGLKLNTETDLSVETETSDEKKPIEIPYTPDGGCFSVKCTINDLPLNFIFDTGASTVSISQLEANFMLKNGYLQHSDFIGTGRFINADGDVSEGSIINLREVEFGGLKLSNVKASVVRNQKAPLLLGQSVLGRLGTIEIDNANRKLIIKTYRK